MEKIYIHQQAITDKISKNGLYVYCNLKVQDKDHLYQTLYIIKRLIDGKSILLGLGKDVIKLMGADIPDLKEFPSFNHDTIAIPSTQNSMLLWFRGSDRGKLFHQLLLLHDFIKDTFDIDDIVEAFSYCGNADLSGFLDGAANPDENIVCDVALVDSKNLKLNGSSFLVTQKWQHNFTILNSMGQRDKEDSIGRSLINNEKLLSLKPESHVKRTEQRSFSPAAILKRSSMPWSNGLEGGLMFTAFSNSFYPFEVQMKKMLGYDDGIVDALFKFSTPLTGAYFWVPAFKTGRLDLSILGI